MQASGKATSGLEEICPSYIHSDSLTWKWKMVPWKTTFLYEQGVFHFHVMCSSECTQLPTFQCQFLQRITHPDEPQCKDFLNVCFFMFLLCSSVFVGKKKDRVANQVEPNKVFLLPATAAVSVGQRASETRRPGECGQ